MELASLNIETILFWNRVQYFGILSFPTLYLLFTFQYIGRDKWISMRNIMLLFVVPFILFWIKMFDGNFHLIYKTVAIEPNGAIQLLSFTRGPVYPIISLYNISVLTFGNILLWQKRKFASSLYRSQTNIILITVFLLYLFYIIYLSEFPLPPGLKNLDLNPFVFTLWVFAVSWAMFRYHLFDLSPIAREVLIENMNDSVLVMDEQYRIVDVNPAAQRIFKWTKSPVGEMAVRVLQKWDYQTAPSHIIENSILNRPGMREIRHDADGKSQFFEITISILEDKKGKVVGRLMVMHDITSRKMAAIKLLELSLVDEMTGLNNRRGFNLLANQMIQMAQRMKLPVVAIYADLDGLKRVNDNLGHGIGDQVIVETANILKSALRSSDIIARLGGDEFVILALESSEYSCKTILDRIEENFQNRNNQPNRRYQLSLSFGFARSTPDDPCSLETLLEKSDKSMYEQKQAKKNKVKEDK